MFQRPHIMGIVNITQDSFSDGGLYLHPAQAINHALNLVEDGADIIDLGPASSHPDSESIQYQAEIARLSPVIPELKNQKIRLSVDTCLRETQEFSLQAGVDFINDITAFPDRRAYEFLASSNAGLIMMHSIQESTKATRELSDATGILDRIRRFFESRLNQLSSAGIQLNRCILDPGMGFFLGSNPDSSIAVLKGIQVLKAEFHLPVLVGVSRKSFLGKITGRETRDLGAASLASEIFASLNGADYIRTHDAKALSDALTVLDKLYS